VQRWAAVSGLILSALALSAADTAKTAATQPEYSATQRQFWSLQPRNHPAIPEFSDPGDRAWVRTPVDAFILAKLKATGLRPSPEASRPILMRRLYFDLIGLPPSPEEIATFANDPAPDAYEKLVDRLLADPRYGEHWAQHWLDVVRYAETEGFEYDRTVHGLWRYRDYVIRAFNEDKPYDQFVREQLAGDEITPADEDALIAAGFHRLGAVRRNAGNQEVASSRNEVLTERTDIVGAAFLGLTLGCARCHDHMFDPIKQKDYYRMEAFLAGSEEHQFILASRQEQDAWKETTDRLNAEIKNLRNQAEQLAEGAVKQEMARKIEQLEANLPPPLPAIASISTSDEPTPIHVLNRGNYDQKGDGVGMRPLGVLLPEGAEELPLNAPHPKTRLATWLTDPNHPLTARVMVNRIWTDRFGKGIVNTPNDFGMNGERPSHPELLDYLANEFVANGWKMKPIHRLMLLSSTYRQASSTPMSEIAAAKDPENRLLWKFSRRRLESEEIRDAMLAVSGILNPEMYGPSVMVPVDKELVAMLYAPKQWQVAEDAAEYQRRSIYLIAKRNLRLPFMEAFDQPALLTSCARRESSTHAPQALELLNGDFSNQMARAFAARLDNEAGATATQQVERAYWLATGRAPSDEERVLAMKFVEQQPFSEFALAMFNLNAFLYVN
jgi:Protein of unknown function (DUF1553)/Protein of unknown function (DUF1549)